MSPSTPSRPAARRAEQARAKAARSKRRKTLGLEAIIDVALRLVDREGVDAVSMRRVAAEFDTGPASLYAYVSNKDELLRLVLDRVIEEIAVPDTGDWREALRTYCHSAHDVFVRHNDIARLNFAHIPSGANMLEGTERLLGAMIDGGVPTKVATWALDILSLYISADAFEGWIFGERFADGSGRDPEELGQEYVRGIAEYFATLPRDRYPNLVGNLDVMMTGTGEERFAFGIDILIAGIAAQVPRRD